MDTHAPDQFGYRSLWGTTMPRMAMETRRGIVLVCKSWNIIATPLLYECVELQTQAGTEMLLRTLKLRARQGGSQEHSEESYA